MTSDGHALEIEADGPRSMTAAAMRRRDFLVLSGGLGLSLSLMQLRWASPAAAADAARPAEEGAAYASWEDVYRNEWRWDRVTWGSHTNQCAPGGCSFYVYTREGIVWREEQAAASYASNPDYPDYNPQGCQKGCGFHHSLVTGERVTHPLKRVGERGSGRWQRIGWDQALGEIADAILDAHESFGTESFIVDGPHIHAGNVALAGCMRLATRLNALIPDLNVGIGDDFKGIHQTFGKMAQGYTADNFFDAELIILTNCNVSYTWPTSYHFLTEARYNGSEVILVAPDYNATALTADIHIPVTVASDSALWLAVCQAMIADGLHQPDFIREQTDLALLVRRDSGRYLRASDVDGGDDEQLYFLDGRRDEIVEAPRRTLEFKREQVLEGTRALTLADGSRVDVSPAFQLLREKLDREYTPERASEICGVHPDIIRDLAHKVATRRTCSFIGFTSAKHYHGDLMERSLILAMALSGNWGKPGTGFNCFLVPEVGIGPLAGLEHPIGSLAMWRSMLPFVLRAQWQKLTRRDLSDELLSIETRQEMSKLVGSVPPVFYLYNHAGYDELWDRKDWQDPSLDKTFGEYMREAISRGYWDERQIQPTPEKTPQVLMLLAHNPLRRARSGRRMFVEKLFPKLQMLFAVETRLSSSAMFCDIVLPAAWYYEKADMTLTFGLNPYTCLIEKAVDPPGEARPEWEIFSALMQKIGERAAERGIESFRDRAGVERAYADLHDRFTMGGRLLTQEDALREAVRAAVAVGTFPQGYDYQKFAEQGQVRIEGLGAALSLTAAADVDPTRPFYSLAWHVDRKKVYPTYARRAQFYIDHEWFLEAGEALPTHKDTPPIGGVHPFRLVSGHLRGSIHSMHAGTPELMRLHRGQPVVFLNDRVAAERGIEDGETVRLFNDYDDVELMVSTSAAVGPDQVVIYMWEPFQFSGWKSHDAMLIGMPKSLQLAGDYGQLHYRSMTGSPSPASDRGLRVDVAKLSASRPGPGPEGVA